MTSIPTANTTMVAIAKRMVSNQLTKPAPRRLTRVLSTWSTPHSAEAVSSRALGLVMLRTPITQTTTRTAHSAISTGRGTTRLTGGTRVAATIPVNSAIED